MTSTELLYSAQPQRAVLHGSSVHTRVPHTPPLQLPTQHTANTTAYQLAVMNQVSQVLHVQAQPRGVEGLAHQTNMLVDVSAGDEGNKTHQ